MRIAIVALLLLTTIALAGCETKAQKVDRALQALKEFNKAHPDYQAKCVPHSYGTGRYDDIASPDALNLLSGRKATAEERAEYVAKTNARAAQCKPLDDQYLQLQRQLDEAQKQAAGAVSTNP